MIILKHVISMRVLQKKSKLRQPRAANSITKWYHANFRFISAPNFLLKPFYLTRVLWLLMAVIDCVLVQLTHFCLSVIQEPEIWCFLAFFMVKLKEVYVVSSSKLSMSKSAKIFHFIFGISLFESHAFSWVQKSAPVCENTIFKLSLCQISAHWMRYFCQFCSFI